MPIKDKWAPFTEEVVEALSLTETGVYELGCGNRVVYIGKGVIRTRLLDHMEKKKFATATHFRKRRTSPDEASRAEARLIDEFCKQNNGNLPKLNTQKPKLEKPGDWYFK